MIDSKREEIGMNEKRYMISDASKQLEVEPHVLRYWEDELDMKIKRNEMGHRYYTEEDIRVLKSVRDMKNQGFQLKAIKQVLSELYENPGYNWTSVKCMEESSVVVENENNVPVDKEISIANASSPELKLEQFQEIMIRIIGKALEENRESLSGALSSEISDQVSMKMTDKISDLSDQVSMTVTDKISDLSDQVSVKVTDKISNQVSLKVTERVVKEMDYMMRENEEREEERFRKLDEAIRTKQKANAEAAAALNEEEKRKKKKKKLFHKKEKIKPRILS